MATPDLIFASEISAPDLTPLLRALEDAAKRGEKALSNIGENLKIDPKGFDTLKIAMEGVEAGFRDSQKVAKSFEQSARDALATLVLDGKKGTAEWNKQLDVLKAARAEAEKYDAALGEVESSIDKATKASTGLSSTLVNAAAAGALLQGAGDFLSSFSEGGVALRDSLRQVQAQTGATAEEMKVLQSSAEDAFKKGVGENLSEATKALGTAKQMLGNFLEDDELGVFVQRAGGIGKVFDKDVNEVIAKGRTFIAQFGLDGQEAGDLLSFAMQKGGSAMDDVLDTTDEYSQLAVQAGYDAQEFVGTLIAGVQAGARDTDKLADALKEAQIRLKAGDISKTLSEIGAPVARAIEGIVAAGEAGQLSVKEVLQRTTELTEDAFNSGQISESIRTQLQVAVAGTPAEDIGSDIYARVFGAEIDTAQITEQAKKAGEAMANAIEPQSFFERVEKSFSVLQAKASAAFAPIIAGAGNVLTSVGQIAPGLSFLGQKFSDLGGMSGVMDKLKGSVGGLGKNLLIAGGAALAIGVAVGIFTHLYETNEQFKASIDGLLQTLKDVGSQILAAIEPVISQLGQTLAPILSQLGTEIAGLLTSIAPTLSKVASLAGSILSQVVGVAGKLLSSLMPAISTLLGVGGELLGVVGDVVGILLESLSPVLDVVAQTVAILGSAIGESLSIVLQELSPILQFVAGLVGELAKVIGLVLGEALKFIMPLFQEAARIQGVVMKEAIQFMVTGFKLLIEALKDVGEAIGGFFVKAWQKAKDMVSSAVKVFKDIVGFISDIGSAVLDVLDIIPGFGDAIDFVGDTVSGAIDGIADFFGFGGDKIEESAAHATAAAQRMSNDVGKMLVATINRVKAAADALNAIKSGVGGFVNNLFGANKEEEGKTAPSPVSAPTSGGGGSTPDPFDTEIAKVDAAQEEALLTLLEVFAKKRDEVRASEVLDAEEKEETLTALKEREESIRADIEEDYARKRQATAERLAAKGNKKAKEQLTQLRGDTIRASEEAIESLSESLEKLDDRLTDFTAGQTENIEKLFESYAPLRDLFDTLKDSVKEVEPIDLDSYFSSLDTYTDSLAPTIRLFVEADETSMDEAFDDLTRSILLEPDLGTPEETQLRDVARSIAEQWKTGDTFKEAREALADALFSTDGELETRIEEIGKVIDETLPVLLEGEATAEEIAAREVERAKATGELVVLANREANKKRLEDTKAFVDAATKIEADGVKQRSKLYDILGASIKAVYDSIRQVTGEQSKEDEEERQKRFADIEKERELLRKLYRELQITSQEFVDRWADLNEQELELDIDTSGLDSLRQSIVTTFQTIGDSLDSLAEKFSSDSFGSLSEGILATVAGNAEEAAVAFQTMRDNAIAAGAAIGGSFITDTLSVLGDDIPDKLERIGVAFFDMAQQALNALLPLIAVKAVEQFGVIAGIAATIGGFAAITAALSAARKAVEPSEGFASGGYTGNGSRKDPAGIVHGREYVIKADIVEMLGVDFFDAINNATTLQGVARSIQSSDPFKELGFSGDDPTKGGTLVWNNVSAVGGDSLLRRLQTLQGGDGLLPLLEKCHAITRATIDSVTTVQAQIDSFSEPDNGQILGRISSASMSKDLQRWLDELQIVDTSPIYGDFSWNISAPSSPPRIPAFGAMPPISSPPYPGNVAPDRLPRGREGQIVVEGGIVAELQAMRKETNARLETLVNDTRMDKELMKQQTRTIEEQTQEVKKLKPQKQYSGV